MGTLALSDLMHSLTVVAVLLGGYPVVGVCSDCDGISSFLSESSSWSNAHPSAAVVIGSVSGGASTTLRQGGQVLNVQDAEEALSRILLRLTQDVRAVIFFARQSLARDSGTEIGSEHMLSGILEVAPDLIRRHASPDWTVARLKGRLASMGVSFQKPLRNSSVRLGASLTRVLFRAAVEADALNAQDIDVGHILVALIGDESSSGDLLREAGLEREQVVSFLVQH